MQDTAQGFCKVKRLLRHPVSVYPDSAVHPVQEVTAIWTEVLTVLRHKGCDPIPGRRQEENCETLGPVSTPPMIQGQKMLLSDLCDQQHAA